MSAAVDSAIGTANALPGIGVRISNDEQGLIRDIGGESPVVGVSGSGMPVEVNGLPFDRLLAQVRSILQEG